MFNFHKNLRNLVLVSAIVFIGLSIFIAVMPAYDLHYVEALPSMEPFTESEQHGLQIYVKENCVACHTQQVRNIEMDNVWGDRPSIPSDYYYSKARLDFWRQSPSLLGSERTGPDLTSVGKRQPGKEWHLLHLYNPRIVVKESIMPGYPWLFEAKSESEITEEDVVVAVPAEFSKNPDKKIVAKKEALDLTAYLISLVQADINGAPAMDFIPAKTVKSSGKSGEASSSGLDGAALYASNCAACHQADGSGLTGAFPPVAGSPIVTGDDTDLFLEIILRGYDARPEYAVMVGFADVLTDEEIAAIATHERTSWGNNGSEITAEEVAKVREYIEGLNQ